MARKEIETYEKFCRRMIDSKNGVVVTFMCLCIAAAWVSVHWFTYKLGVLRICNIALYMSIGVYLMALGVIFILIHKHHGVGKRYPEFYEQWFQSYYERRPRLLKEKIEQFCVKHPDRTPMDVISNITKRAELIGWICVTVGIVFTAQAIYLQVKYKNDLETIYIFRMLDRIPSPSI